MRIWPTRVAHGGACEGLQCVLYGHSTGEPQWQLWVGSRQSDPLYPMSAEGSQADARATAAMVLQVFMIHFLG